MNILLIDGSRFIGAHVARRLHDAGAELVAFHRGPSTNSILPDIEHVLDPKAEYGNRTLKRWTLSSPTKPAASAAANLSKDTVLFAAGDRRPPHARKYLLKRPDFGLS